MSIKTKEEERPSEEKNIERVVIVGGGPAGLAAAKVLARGGVSVTIIDENPELGGQYYRRRTENAMNRFGDYRIKGTRLIDSVRTLGCVVLTDSYVWGMANDKKSLLIENSIHPGSIRIEFDYLIVASGAHEVQYPFTNWDSIKVMTPGMLSRLVTIDMAPIAQHIILAGSGPFLLAAASHLLDSGVAIDGVFEMARPYRFSKYSMLVIFFPSKFCTFVYLRIKLMKGRVRLKQGWRVRSVQESTDGIIAIFDQTSSKNEMLVKSELLGVAYGFKPNSELLEMLNVEQTQPTIFGHFFPHVDRNGRTSQRNIFAVGEASSIQGFKSASSGGILSGERILRDIKGKSSFQSWSNTLIHYIQSTHENLFAKLLKKLYEFSPEDFADLDGTVLFCRCEGVYSFELNSAISQCAGDVAYVKAETRVGMGICQGRMCGSALNILIRKSFPNSITSGFSIRIPFRPISISSIISMDSSIQRVVNDE